MKKGKFMKVKKKKKKKKRKPLKHRRGN